MIDNKAKDVKDKMKINMIRVLLASVIVTFVAQVIHSLGAVIGMGFYQMPDYFPVWSKIMMPEPGPPPMEFMYFSLVFGFISALLFVIVYVIVRKSIPGNSTTSKGLVYGGLIFLVAGLPSLFSFYLLINLPAGLIWLWGAESLIAYAANGAIVGSLIG